MILSQKRGKAASGMFSSNTDGVGSHKIQTLRSPLKAAAMLESTAGASMVRTLSNYTNFMVGHTRASTPGAGTAKNNYNNHPHVCGKIIGVHNGVIDKEKPTRTLQGQYDLKGTCDSELLFALIDHKIKRGASRATAIRDTLLEVKGWYSLIMMNTEKPQEINVVRDSSTPLEAIWWPDGNCYIVASENGFLQKVVEKYELKNTSSQVILDKVLFTLDTTQASDLGMIKRSAIHLNPKDNRSYVEANKKTYEKTQGR
jgi:glucosamine 6-phosphate synthetase-like amidotransferase/phosphosugar isomerase protein